VFTALNILKRNIGSRRDYSKLRFGGKSLGSFKLITYIIYSVGGYFLLNFSVEKSLCIGGIPIVWGGPS